MIKFLVGVLLFLVLGAAGVGVVALAEVCLGLPKQIGLFVLALYGSVLARELTELMASI